MHAGSGEGVGERAVDGVTMLRGKPPAWAASYGDGSGYGDGYGSGSGDGDGDGY